ncbi:MAG: DUF1015 domain-containing protein [Desulfobacterota bacterium]|nr:DUF1015 domain-containing protein [Thermodesulfobacteriota bacterium]
MSFPDSIKPFKGLLYNPEVVNDLSSCICPPYDVIDEPKYYYRMSPYNAIKLELPMDSKKANRYEAARITLQKWINERVLIEDEESIYICEQTFTLDGETYKRRGFLALIGLDRERILTHERTRREPKEDRERLFRAIKTFTNFVFGLYADKEERIEEIIDGAKKEKLFEFVEENEIHTEFHRVRLKRDIDRIREFMENKKIYIADGHHRLAVFKRLRLKHIPIYLTNMFSRGLRILPYHRLVRFRDGERTEEILQLLLKKYPHSAYKIPGENLKELKSKIEDPQTVSFGFLRKENPEVIYIFEIERRGHEERKDPSKKLKIQMIHNRVIKGLLKIKDREIDFIPWLEKAKKLMKEGHVDVAFICPAVTVDEIKSVAEAKLTMPPKSTYFYPKLPTGPIFYRYG